MAQYTMSYRRVKAKNAHTGPLISLEDRDALDAIRDAHGNRDMMISVPFFESDDPSSRRTCALCFRIRSSSLEQARDSALQAMCYLAENCGIPPENIDLTYNGGGIVTQDDGQASAGAATPAEIVILASPAVFGGSPTPCMPLLNYDLARLMLADGITNLDVDCYVRDHFVPLPDSICTATGRFIVRISIRELLYLSPGRIYDLSRQPRDIDFSTSGHLVPEAADWFAEALREQEKRAQRRSQLREHLLRLGWAVPPCVRRLDWADLSEDDAVEACRIIARFYPFIGAGEDEVWYHVRRLDQRHGIHDYPLLRNIVRFGNENPAFVGCEHPLLLQLCPAGGCFMKDVIDELQSPRLFT